MQRIQKIIANSGYCSRRKAEDLIEQGIVKLNGETAKLGDKANPEDKIKINGELLIVSDKNFYYVLNKPKGILVTKDDPQKRRTIYDLKSMISLEEQIGKTLNYVGRLDGLSEGLLILTNDGELNNKLTHPKHHVKKTYLIRTEPKIKQEDILKLKKGILIDDAKFFAEVSNIKANTFHISIGEGRNRIIRNTLSKLNYEIFQLKRISVGEVKLGNLKDGEIRELTQKEINSLKAN
jgi:23S rRNA pseudouridine2605 synthase